MDINIYYSEIVEKVRRKIIYEGLELEELGIDIADIKEDTLLFNQDGLALDSVDTLEILAGVQREFGVTFEEVDADFIEKHASTTKKIAETVLHNLKG